MEEILHHQGCIKPNVKNGINYPTGDRRISSINSITTHNIGTKLQNVDIPGWVRDEITIVGSLVYELFTGWTIPFTNYSL